MHHKQPRRLCLTCQTPCKGPHNRYCSPGCVPTALRALGGRKARQNSSYRMRALKFRDDIAQLRSGPVTQEDLLALCQRIYDRGRGAERNAVYTRNLKLAREAKAS